MQSNPNTILAVGLTFVMTTLGLPRMSVAPQQEEAR